MGQYFIAALLDTTGRITRAVHPVHYGSLHKLGGHSRPATPFLAAVETLLSLDSGSRLVWAGDEADPEPGQEANLYWLAEPHQFVRFADLVDPDSDVAPNATRPAVVGAGRYVCNTDRSEYFDKAALPKGPHGERRNLLPALTADGYGITGPWARNHIHLTDTRPDAGWTQLRTAPVM